VTPWSGRPNPILARTPRAAHHCPQTGFAAAIQAAAWWIPFPAASATSIAQETSMDTKHPCNTRRRTLLKAAAGIPALGLAGSLISTDASAQAAGKTAVNLQLGWLPGNNQIGEVVAKQLGYFAQEGLDVSIQPGGPNIDGVAIVASGKYEMGQVSSSPSLMLAASQDLPVKCFATGLQQHPYTFFSLKKKPVNAPKDMAGKKVGIQATGVILLRALLAKNNIPESSVEIVTIGADMSPLLTGQVDVVTGWQTNVTALKPLGPDRVDLRLWDAGVRLYALPYYATVKTIQTRPDVLQKFLRATAKGYAYTNANREAATDLLIKEYPNLTRADEKVGIDAMMGYAFNDLTKANGWGTMDPGVWQDQISLYSQLGQFSKRTPKLDEVMTMEILAATRDARAKI
jgi:NitT/TauT family transport system substrate-binding protein